MVSLIRYKLYIIKLSYRGIPASHCMLEQKMTGLNVNDYCSGESGAQPASTNPSLETKKTKVGPL